MLYKGTKNRTSKQISEEIEKNGGILNGFTEEELTAYWCKMPSSKIKIGLDVLSDMILNPLFDRKELEKERQVIFEEMKMRKDRPDIFVMDKIQSFLFTGNLSLDLIGTEKSMSSITRDILIKKFSQAYSSNNLILCVVGDSNFKKLCEYCEKTFPKTKKSITEPKIGIKNKKSLLQRKGIDQANMVFAFHIPKATEKLNYAAQVLNCIMAGGMSSKLFQEIREKRNLAYAVKGSSNSGRRFGYNYIYIGAKKENIEKIKEIILDEFKKLSNLKEKELSQAKEQLIGQSKISREDSQGQMVDLLYNEIIENAKKSYDYEKNIKKVKLSDVKKLSKIKDYSFLALVPE